MDRIDPYDLDAIVAAILAASGEAPDVAARVDTYWETLKALRRRRKDGVHAMAEEAAKKAV